MVIAREGGEISYVDANEIVVLESTGSVARYTLKKFVGSNQGTCINQKPIVSKGEKVRKGQVLADGHSMLLPMSARLVSSFSRKGMSAVATLIIWRGDTST